MAAKAPLETLTLHKQKLVGLAEHIRGLDGYKKFAERMLGVPFDAENTIDVTTLVWGLRDITDRAHNDRLIREDCQLGHDLELVACRWMAVPHDDTHIPLPWTHFLMLRSDGMAVGTPAAHNRNADQIGDVMSLYIHDLHWVMPAYDQVHEPYLWIAAGFASTQSLSQKAVRRIFMDIGEQELEWRAGS